MDPGTDNDRPVGRHQSSIGQIMYWAIRQALGGSSLPESERAAVQAFVRQEAPGLFSRRTKYLLLGSYRGSKHVRLRAVAHELNRRFDSYVSLVGDTPSLDLSDQTLPAFRLKFYIMAAYADYIVGVIEQDGGGEINELGKTSPPALWQRTWLMPRDFYLGNANRIAAPTRAAVYAAACAVAFDDSIPPTEAGQQIDTFIQQAQAAGVSIDRTDVVNVLHERQASGEPVVAYSWVHRNDFRLAARADRCLPWVREADLRETTADIP